MFRAGIARTIVKKLPENLKIVGALSTIDPINAHICEIELVSTIKLGDLYDEIEKNNDIINVILLDDKRFSFEINHEGVYYPVIVWYTTKENKPFMLFSKRGAKGWIIGMRKIAKSMGLKLSEYGMYQDDKRMNITSERGIFRALGKPYKVPSLRK